MDKIQIWDMLLKFAPGKSATIAGGAVRDYLCGDRDFKDIDVFINVEHDEPYRFPPDAQMQRKANVNVQLNPEYQMDGNGNGVQLIDNFDLILPERDRAIPVQFIYVNGSVRDYILKRFDLDICQAWYRKGIISTTAEFNRAHDTSTIGNINGFNGQRTKDHAERIIQRAYEGWEYEEVPVMGVGPVPGPDVAPMQERLADFVVQRARLGAAGMEPNNGFVIQGNGIQFVNRFQMNDEPVQ